MPNATGRGPSRQDKTIERMKQEMASPGASTAGVPGADLSNEENVAARRAGVQQSDSSVVASDAPAGAAADAPDQDKVREDAYRRFAARGYVHGRDREDWDEAEREVRASKARKR